jgi:hypothetical protein
LNNLILENSPSYVVIQDSAFDGTTISVLDPADGDFACSYNAYDGTPFLPNDNEDVFVSSFNWQRGPFGNYYLPGGSPLVDANHQAGDPPADTILVGTGNAGHVATLAAFTTDPVNQMPDTGPVDMGYHYPTAGISQEVWVSGNSPAQDNSKIQTYDFSDGALVVNPPFLPDNHIDGRGLAIYSGNFYYTEVSYNPPYGTDAIHVCPYNGGFGGHDDTSRTIPNPDQRVDKNGSTAGIAALSFHFDPNTGKTELYALTGYALAANSDGTTNQPEVWEIDPDTKQPIFVNGTFDTYHVTIPTPVNPGEPDSLYSTSDGFTVLPNGDFLINDWDGYNACTIYREYNGKTGALVPPPPSGNGLQVDLSAFSGVTYGGNDYGTGVAISPDRKSLYFMAGVTPHPYPQTLIQTDLSGNLLGAQSIDSGTWGAIEDIDVVIPQ